MGKVIIVGHKNPDTDSIISALGAVEYFDKVLGKEAKAFRAGQLNNETKFILEYFGVETPDLINSLEADSSVALVDHNEKSQVFDQLDFSSVDYIFDHHKLSVTTEKPISCRMEPIGSTSSLIAKMLFEKSVAPSAEVAPLLLAGILSDTLNLVSPTTTAEDKELVEKLNAIAKIDIADFVSQMFKAKSSLEGISIEEIISIDFKPFEMGKSLVGVGTWETTDSESVNSKKDEIIKALLAKKQADKMDFMFFMVVDIIAQNCELYIIGEAEKVLAEKVFGGQIESQSMFLPGVVSRKKQIIPQLTEELSK